MLDQQITMIQGDKPGQEQNPRSQIDLTPFGVDPSQPNNNPSQRQGSQPQHVKAPVIDALARQNLSQQHKTNAQMEEGKNRQAHHPGNFAAPPGIAPAD